jgi:hypothetical protein
MKWNCLVQDRQVVACTEQVAACTEQVAACTEQVAACTEQVAACSEQGNKPSGSIKSGEFMTG